MSTMICTMEARRAWRAREWAESVCYDWPTKLTVVQQSAVRGGTSQARRASPVAARAGHFTEHDGVLAYPGNSSLTLIPHLAASLPAVSNRGRTYTFHLKHGLVFSNGDPVTAQDFVYSWERMLAPKTASPDTYLWYAVQGESAFT